MREALHSLLDAKPVYTVYCHELCHNPLATRAGPYHATPCYPLEYAQQNLALSATSNASGQASSDAWKLGAPGMLMQEAP